MRAIVILDFDNFFPLATLSEYDGDNGLFNRVFQFVISQLAENDSVDSIKFRLYSGWYSEDALTNRSSEVLRRLSSFNSLFPCFVRGRKIEGDFVLAENQVDIPFIWKNTYRERHGLPKFRVDETKMSPACRSNTTTCPVHILKHFSKKATTPCSVNSCTTKHGEVFKLREQKMVDTMMACDVISCSLDEDKPLVAIVSDDVDIFPSIALRNKISSESTTIMFIKNDMNVVPYSSILNQFNATILLMPYE